jgi:sialic acid synthase SpsE
MGAVVIEKHLTLDRKQEGPDHKASIEPSVFKTMVQSIRDVEILLGSREKWPQPCEEDCIKAWT